MSRTRWGRKETAELGKEEGSAGHHQNGEAKPRAVANPAKRNDRQWQRNGHRSIQCSHPHGNQFSHDRDPVHWNNQQQQTNNKVTKNTQKVKKNAFLLDKTR